MTPLKLKYAASIIIILTHFFGCEQSWDHRIQEDFLNLLRSKNHFNSGNAHFDKGYDILKWAEPETKMSSLHTFFKSNASILDGDQLQLKLLGNIGNELTSRIDRMTLKFKNISIQFELHPLAESSTGL